MSGPPLRRRILSLGLCTLAACAHAGPAATSVPRSFTAQVTGSGRPVIILPDLGAPAEVWQGAVEHLGDRFQAHVLDVAGFAGNAPVAGPLLPALRADLASHLRERKLEGAVIVGQGFGATVAYWLAMTEPDLVGGVVAVDAPPSRVSGDPEDEAEAREGAKALSQASPERFAQMTKHRLSTSMDDQAKAERLAAKAARSDQRAVADAFLDAMTRDLRSEVAKIRAPLLVVLTTGNLPEEAVPMVERLYRDQLAPVPSSELVVVPKARHDVMFDAPEPFFAALDRFLAATVR